MFGFIAERAGTDVLTLDAGSVHALRRMLEARIDGITGSNFAIAVDRRIIHDDIALTGHEEIAVLPPFAGG